MRQAWLFAVAAAVVATVASSYSAKERVAVASPSAPLAEPGSDEPPCCGKAGSRATMLTGLGDSTRPENMERSSTPDPNSTGEAHSASEPIPDALEGMIFIPGGEFTMGGVGNESRSDEFPCHRVRVSSFYIDQTEVTVGQFKRFVAATHYVTTAERKPDWSELAKELPPGTKKPSDSVLVAGSMVFTPTNGPVPLDDWTRWWRWVPGADWKHPLGDGESVLDTDRFDDRPVVQVSFEDALAYCDWAGKRLPTEAEWEFACRGGREGEPFAWGFEPPSVRHHEANLWQGAFPYAGEPLDGYLLAAPVKSYPPNGYGLYDMIGNVWEWCSDWYREDAYRIAIEHSDGAGFVIDPTGPSSSFDPTEPTAPKRVIRGGSFLCSSQYCASYRPSARMRTSMDSAQNHLGFRCVTTKELAAARARNPSSQH